MEEKYRYPGTRPFLEEDSHLFFGRNSDKEKLTELIVLENLVVLFGKSGYGKTSLLNAAVIPRLRGGEQHEVFKVRLIEPKRSNETRRSPLELLIAQLSKENISTTFLPGKLDIADLSDDLTAIIWYYAKIIQLNNTDAKAITLIFDQFEELSQFSDEEIEAFGRSMGTLLNLNLPKSVRNLIVQKLDTNEDYLSNDEKRDLLKPLNLKVVFSLHHDRLSLLDQLKSFLPTIFKYTYKLKPLSEQQARDGFLKPAAVAGHYTSPEFTYTEEVTSFIFEYLKDSKNQLIEPFQLQLIGQHAEGIAIDKNKKAQRIANLKAKFIKQKEDTDEAKLELGVKDLGKPTTIFKKHYQKVIGSLSIWKRPKVRRLIETVLIMEGNRVPMPEVAITKRHHVTKKSLEELLDKRLLRSELNTVQDTSYELSHDSLVKPIQESAERRKRRRLWIIVVGLLLLIIAGLLGWVYCLSSQIKTENPEDIENSDGSEKTITDEVEVSNGLIINAIATATVLPTEGPARLDVRFTFTEIDTLGEVSVVRYYWEFGDDTRSNDNNPDLHHTYDKPKVYTARLNVICTDSLVRPMRTEEVTITVSKPKDSVADPLVTSFSGVSIRATPGSGDAPLKVVFSATISEGISASKYLWEFSDPSPSTEASPTHKFKDKGVYNVRLTVRDTEGISYMDSTKITVRPIGPFVSDPPVAMAKAFDLEDQNPLTYRFSGEESTDDIGIVRYFWEFHEGSEAFSADTVYTFDKAGFYKPRLTVWDKEGQSDSYTLDLEIRNPPISPDTIPPLAVATVSIINEDSPLEFEFIGSNSTDNIAINRYLWEFEPDSTSTKPDPIYVFKGPGDYTVKLTVWDAMENNNSINLIVIVPEIPNPPKPPVAILSASPTEGFQPLDVSFNGSNSTDDNEIVSYHWYFEPGYESSAATIQHTFVDAGTFKVKLTVKDDQGLPGDTTIEIRVKPVDTLNSPIDEGEKWMKRFIRIQEKSLSQNELKNSRITPDSLNIMGVLPPDSFLVSDSTSNTPAALLFFFTTKGMEEGENIVYKYRSEINPSETKTMLRSERFSLKRLIKEAQDLSKNMETDTILKFIAPNKNPVRAHKSDFKDFAELLEKNRINNKTLNVYYTLFPFEYFDTATQTEIRTILQLLGPPSSSIVKE